MATVTNPTQFTITDPTASKDKVTGFNVHLGQTSGKYTLVAAVPAKDLTGLANGQVTGPISDLNLMLAPGTWYAVANAVNAVGESIGSAEVSFDILGVPAPPTGFTLV